MQSWQLHNFVRKAQLCFVCFRANVVSHH